MLDRDLADIYGVSTQRLNEQVRRNRDRFPEDFMFQLTLEEAKAIFASRSQFATLKRGQNPKYSPYAFTEHGSRKLEGVVIQGYLPLLTRPAHIVYFFRDVHGECPTTAQANAFGSPQIFLPAVKPL